MFHESCSFIYSYCLDVSIHLGICRWSPKLDRSFKKGRCIIISTCSKLSENVIKNFEIFYWWDPLAGNRSLQDHFWTGRILRLDELNKMVYSEVFISIDKYLFRLDSLFSTTCRSWMSCLLTQKLRVSPKLDRNLNFWRWILISTSSCASVNSSLLG